MDDNIYGAYIRGRYFQCIADSLSEAVLFLYKQASLSLNTDWQNGSELEAMSPIRLSEVSAAVFGL